jgi:hypothetical protein
MVGGTARNVVDRYGNTAQQTRSGYLLRLYTGDSRRSNQIKKMAVRIVEAMQASSLTYSGFHFLIQCSLVRLHRVGRSNDGAA